MVTLPATGTDSKIVVEFHQAPYALCSLRYASVWVTHCALTPSALRVFSLRRFVHVRIGEL